LAGFLVARLSLLMRGLAFAAAALLLAPGPHVALLGLDVPVLDVSGLALLLLLGMRNARAKAPDARRGQLG
jgi:hypothetical protein